jgi:hypothetical protein
LVYAWFDNFSAKRGDVEHPRGGVIPSQQNY